MIRSLKLSQKNFTILKLLPLLTALTILDRKVKNLNDFRKGVLFIRELFIT